VLVVVDIDDLRDLGLMLRDPQRAKARLMELIGRSPSLDEVRPLPPPPEVEGPRALVLDALTDEWVLLGDVAAKLGWSNERLRHHLKTLLNAGLVERDDRRWRLVA
jgi:biotin operon repressor